MQIWIPESAIQACVVTGSVVYIVLNTSGQIAGLFVKQSGHGVAAVAGAAVGCLAGTVAGVMTTELLGAASDGYFVPAIEMGSRVGSVGLAAGAGLTAGLLVTLYYHGSHFVIQAAQKFKKQDATPIDYDLGLEEDFSVVTLLSALGNLPEPIKKIESSAAGKG